MGQLLLLRHAKSSWDDPALRDHERPLNPRGERAAAAMSNAFASLRLSPDLALVSSSRRTRQTFDALRLNPEALDVEITDRLYLADSETILEMIRGAKEGVRSILVVGHNPGLYDAAMELVGRDPAARPEPPVSRLLDGYPTASLCDFNVEVPWSALAEGAGKLVRFQRPEDFEVPAGGHDRF